MTWHIADNNYTLVKYIFYICWYQWSMRYVGYHCQKELFDAVNLILNLYLFKIYSLSVSFLPLFSFPILHICSLCFPAFPPNSLSFSLSPFFPNYPLLSLSDWGKYVLFHFLSARKWIILITTQKKLKPWKKLKPEMKCFLNPYESKKIGE